ncbi:Uncharacterised protein [Candidatus Venteria ishoeyi]|uniref:Uncharacterized protein n=2 Tax=Candidatus Venteria ishoeyi TaxID=1899563 RepID=A0A1H6F913_9GAMM|nr:Uncharacterised protein [Candidatus Venteria ishoeyi]
MLGMSYKSRLLLICHSRLKALMVLANYERQELDVKTSAEQFFDTSFLDIFDWVLDVMEILPLPQKRAKRLEQVVKFTVCPALS